MEEIIKAFISYSQDSDELKDKIKELNDKLESKGIDVWYDNSPNALSENNTHKEAILKKIYELDRFILIVCSEGYYSKAGSVINSNYDNPHSNSEAAAEFDLLRTEYADPNKLAFKTRFLTILESTENNFRPVPFSSTTYYTFQQVDDIVNYMRDKSKKISELKAEYESKDNNPSFNSRDPYYNSKNFEGRVKDLNELKEKYNDKNINVVCLYGEAGTGKTALARKFAETLPANGIYIFSDELPNSNTSSDTFIERALEFFTGKNEKDFSENKPIYKARLLLEELKKRAFVLIIDAFENLTELDELEDKKVKSTTAHIGKAKTIDDNGIEYLIKNLLTEKLYHDGLLILTSHFEISDVKNGKLGINKKIEILDDQSIETILNKFREQHNELKINDSDINDIKNRCNGNPLVLAIITQFILNKPNEFDTWQRIIPGTENNKEFFKKKG